MGTRILVTNHPSMNDLSMRLILMSFCYHSEVIHMGHQKGEDIVITFLTIKNNNVREGICFGIFTYCNSSEFQETFRVFYIVD